MAAGAGAWRASRGWGRPRLVRESLASLRFLLTSPWLRALLLLRWLPPAFAVAPEALAVPYAAELHAGPAAAGLLLAAAPVGALAGEAVAGVLLDRALRDRLLVPLAVASFLPLLGFAARPGLLLAVALRLLAGVGSAYALGLDQRFFEAAPKPLLERAMSIASAGVMLSNGLGFAAAGAAAQALPPPAVVTAAGIMGLAVVLALARAAHRRFGRATARGRP